MEFVFRKHGYVEYVFRKLPNIFIGRMLVVSLIIVISEANFLCFGGLFVLIISKGGYFWKPRENLIFQNGKAICYGSMRNSCLLLPPNCYFLSHSTHATAQVFPGCWPKVSSGTEVSLRKQAGKTIAQVNVLDS